jgi:hypothetical protein
MDHMDEMFDRRLTISCDECSMRCTTACTDCVVTFLLRDERDGSDDAGSDDATVVLDLDQARVVRLLGQAGLVPGLRYHVAG